MLCNHVCINGHHALLEVDIIINLTVHNMIINLTIHIKYWYNYLYIIHLVWHCLHHAVDYKSSTLILEKVTLELERSHAP